MFTINADDLSATLDKVTPHVPDVPGRDHQKLVILDSVPGWLHAVVPGERTLAVARTPVRNSTAQWSATIAYSDARALRVWLESADKVHVEYGVHTGRPLLRFLEGAAQMAMPVVTDMDELPWRTLLQQETAPTSAPRRVVRINAEDLARWGHVGDDMEMWPASGVAAFVVTAGGDFIGFQLPCFSFPSRDVVADWRRALRCRRFVFDGTQYEVGASYADKWGHAWRMTARPAPGEEPLVVSVESSAVALPLGVVLSTGGHLKRIPA